jgi:NADP-dependent 3-hydroxy acid dehydrogenase YdfG
MVIVNSHSRVSEYHMKPMDIGDRVAVVTGATNGIGSAVARELRQPGMRLVLTGRSAERLSRACVELGAEMLVADIADPAAPELLLRTALERFERCDVVINNAGTIEVGPIASIDIDYWGNPHMCGYPGS